jgi:hypothetical protein
VQCDKRPDTRIARGLRPPMRPSPTTLLGEFGSTNPAPRFRMRKAPISSANEGRLNLRPPGSASVRVKDANLQGFLESPDGSRTQNLPGQTTKNPAISGAFVLHRGDRI